MSLFKKNDDLLDEAIGQVAEEPIDSRQVEAAAARVWARLQADGAAASPAPQATAAAPVAGSLHGCEDFRSLIPAYLRGELSPARALLVEDHTRSCVPCRRALKEAREGQGDRGSKARPAAKQSWARDRRVWMPLAALLAIALGFGLLVVIQEMLAGGSQMARIESVEGTIYRVAGDSSRPMRIGETIDEHEAIRTAKGSTALVRMADGSLIEMGERADLALDASRKGNTIELDRGKIIVQAAKQKDRRHLYVATREAMVSVVGTIFSVNAGTKGSRVSVVEGEVHVEQGERESVLRPGDQVATHASVEAVPVKEEIAWSRNAKRYEALLAELTALGKEIDARVERPGLRYSTRLLDLAPEGTTVWIALPNLSKSLDETQRILDQKIAESPSLAQWWSEMLRSTGNEQKFHEMIEKVGALGRDLGDEVAVAMAAGNAGKHDDDCAPVLLAEVTNEASFRAAVEQEISRQEGSGRHGVRFIDDPATAGEEKDALLVWLHDGLMVASPSAEQIRKVAAGANGSGNAFRSSSFYGRIAQDYRDGAGWLFAADLGTLVREGQADESSESRQMAEKMGVLDLEHFIIDRREINGQAETRAALTFDQPRRGVASWIAAPAPMGGLSFFSPDANLAAAFVVKSPVTILDELLAMNPEFAKELAEAQSKHGFDLRNDLAVPLGGELTLGLDGPVLPSPSWKMAAEVYDPARLQRTLEQAVARINAEAREEGKAGITLTSEESGGRTYYAIQGTDPKVELHYVFEDGYLLAGPSRALLERAIQQRESGVTLATTAKFRDLLGPDGQVNVSALVYQNLAPLAKSASKVIPEGNAKGNGPKNGPAKLTAWLAAQGPTLYYAYAEPDRIVFAGSNQNPLGLNLGTLAGMGGLAGLMDQAHDAAAAAERQADAN
ncbi:MAG TPA: FecR domain-containing protein [Thermoanaerobaculia bacterium]|jgi:ferric-dicitrate binding protein FerR (iron transport regulator)|nr:FecR domain-containing protein [Thermoanaerobaculia bacterium]